MDTAKRMKLIKIIGKIEKNSEFSEKIGAVLLDEQYQEIGYFNTLVKPQYNDQIERRIENLTGITTEMVQNAQPPKQPL